MKNFNFPKNLFLVYLKQTYQIQNSFFNIYIRRFPSHLRNKICELISMMDFQDDERTLNELIGVLKEAKIPRFSELHELLNDKIIGNILKKYLKKLNRVIKEIKRQSENGTIHIYTISREFDINHKILISIIKNLKQKKFIRYNKPIIQKQPSKTATDLYLENKIDIDNYVLKLREEGLTYNEISTKATRNFGINITNWRVSIILGYNPTKK